MDVRGLLPLPALSGQELAGTQLAVGDVVRARVVEAGAQGQPVLMLGAATFAVDLPFPATPDQTLEFTVLEVKPELRLAVSRPPAQLLPQGGSGATDGPDLQLSPEGRLLSRFGETLAAPVSPPRVSIPGSGGEDLLRDPVRLTVALREGVDRSGLFYERHQAQWVSGQRTEESLRQEPQAAWPRSASVGTAAEPDLTSRLAGAGLAGDALEMVRQQVEVFQQQGLMMRTDLAPGYSMEWRARVGEEGGGRDEDPATRRWETAFSSEFGSLDRIDARLSLEGDRLSIALSARPEVIERMRSAAPALGIALAAAGLSVRRLRFEPASPPTAGE